MNYAKCEKLIKRLIVGGSVTLVISIVSRSPLLLVFGFICILAALPMKVIFWRCPYCSAPLPWWKEKYKNFPYRCRQCGNEIEI